MAKKAAWASCAVAAGKAEKHHITLAWREKRHDARGGGREKARRNAGALLPLARASPALEKGGRGFLGRRSGVVRELKRQASAARAWRHGGKNVRIRLSGATRRNEHGAGCLNITGGHRRCNGALCKTSRIWRASKKKKKKKKKRNCGEEWRRVRENRRQRRASRRGVAHSGGNGIMALAWRTRDTLRK